MNYDVSILCDFAVALTYHLHDFGSMGNENIFVDDYCFHNKITNEKVKRVLHAYAKHYVKGNMYWVPSRTEVEQWYNMYGKNA